MKLKMKWAFLTCLILLLGIILFAPVFPSTLAIAKPTTAIKVLEERVHHRTLEDFNQGQEKNVSIHKKGKLVQLTVEEGQREATYTSPVIKAKRVFTDIGIHWKDVSSYKKKNVPNPLLKIEVRYSKNKTDWSDWIEVEGDHGEGPDHDTSDITMGGLVFTEPANYVQYRVLLTAEKERVPHIQDVKLFLLNSLDGEKIVTRKSLGSILFQKAEAAVQRPGIVSREEWGADESLRGDSPIQYADQVTHLVVHHTDTPNNDPVSADARMRSIYYYHTKTNGWNDIGYNAVIGHDGRIYEGRKGKDGEVLTPGVVGAHARSFNNGTFGVSLMGRFDQISLPSHMRTALVDILAYQADYWDIDPVARVDFVRNYEYNDPNIPKTDKDVPTIQGHGLLPRQSTACPGVYVRNDLGSIRTAVKTKVDESAIDRDGIIIDNDDPSVTIKGSSWKKSTNAPGFWGANYHANTLRDGSQSFSWPVNVPEDGTYATYTWYAPYSDRASNAPYSIIYDGGSITKRIDQRSKDPKKWTYLGAYPFSAKSSGKITLSNNNTDGAIIADAIRVKKVNLKRLDGDSRYAVSAKISKEIDDRFIDPDTIVIARGDIFPDALAGGPLAYKEKAPLLLTSSDALPSATKQEIQRLKPTKAIILGGHISVSPAVEDELRGLGITQIDRHVGENRYDQAAKIATLVADETTTTAIVASGQIFTDALSASSVASRNKMPILLVNDKELHSSVEAFVQENPQITKYIIVGGPLTVPDSIKAHLEQYAEVERVYGEDRYSTAVNVVKHFNMDLSNVVITRGDNFPDALSGGPLAAYAGAPLLLNSPNAKHLSSSVDALLKQQSGKINHAYLLGGHLSVTLQAEERLLQYLAE